MVTSVVTLKAQDNRLDDGILKPVYIEGCSRSRENWQPFEHAREEIDQR